MKLPVFRTAKIQNITAASKKPATVSVRLTRTKEDLFYVRRVQSFTEVIGYTDPETELFITKLRPNDTNVNLTHNMFRDLAWRYARDAVDEKLDELAALYESDPEDYKAKYKMLPLIEKELSEYLLDKHEFFIDLDKQISVVRSNPKPHVNKYMLYKDDAIVDDFYATIRLPYLNPSNQTLTDEQSTIVNTFLDVFLDEYHKRALSWYFGAMLLNIPIYDERISKMMIVSSARGGSGKSTLINSLTSALLTDAYRDIRASFDVFFVHNNRFGTSQLLPIRLTQYSEAEFNEQAKKEHNFDGLNISEIKSLISEGYISSEKKYDDIQTERVSSFHIVLTNHPPELDSDRAALKRRILGVVVKPSTMSEKGLVLGMTREQQVYDFVENNAQAFANYFVTAFKNDEQAFTDIDYSYEDMSQEISEGEMTRLAETNLEDGALRELRTLRPVDALTILGDKANVDVSKLVDAIKTEKLKPTKNSDMRWDGDTLYLNSAKDVYIKYGRCTPLRGLLKIVCGEPVKKYGKRMYRLGGES